MSGVGLSFVSVVVDDPVAASTFYAGLFDLAPVPSLGSPHFRGLLLAGTVLGFSAPSALAMLGLAEVTGAEPARSFWTFEVDRDEAVDDLHARALAAGATSAHAPYRTYYGAYQAVLVDPWGHPFRVNHLDIEEVT